VARHARQVSALEAGIELGRYIFIFSV